MKQVLIKRSGILVEEIPAPLIEDGCILVEVAYSLISVGTEVSSVEQHGRTLVQQAREEPAKVLKLLDYLRQHGVSRTIARLQGHLENGSPTGYSCAGRVLQVGRGVTDLQPGMLVACAGAGKANHAEIVLVPRQLVARVPKGCDLKAAASVTLGAIAMQGVRRADPRLGEVVAVIGLGLIGQITVQLLKAAGCRVVSIDIDSRRVALAQKLGADDGLNSGEMDVLSEIRQITAGYGVDSTILTAASQSDELVQQAMHLTRKKGRVVVVGAIGLGLKRSPFYEKEIDFLISSSYGPGRYDPRYEEEGQDYPYAYVRWTENRNMSAYLQLLAEGKVNIHTLMEREYDIRHAPEAYAELQNAMEKPLGVLLSYGVSNPSSKRATQVRLRSFNMDHTDGKITVAVIGAGSFAKGMHLPNLQRLADRYTLHAVVSATGSNAKAAAQQFGAAYATTDFQEVLHDPKINLVMICTRHHLHASQAIAAVRAGKAVFLEKPMALTQAELDELVAVLEETGSPFMVGYNRRFSPSAAEIQRHVAKRHNPLLIHYRMNAGFVPLDHWVHGPEGGGRIIGEACHLVDLFTFFVGARVCALSVHHLTPRTSGLSGADNVVATLEYEDGSLAVLEYFAVGSRQFPKEYMEIHFDEKTLVMDDYKTLSGYGLNVRAVSSSMSQKGQLQELEAFHTVLTDPHCAEKYPIPLWDLVQTSEITFKMREV
jgi:predicted dehydrogenase/threonine dehydrogenase-like Zn-dependent dehydrogenase